MTTGARQHSHADLPLPEQDFVDAAYERLDALRASYRDRQGPRPFDARGRQRASLDGARGPVRASG